MAKICTENLVEPATYSGGRKTLVLAMRCAATTLVHRRDLMLAAKAAGWQVAAMADVGGDLGAVDQLKSLGLPVIGVPVNQSSLNPLSDLRLLFTMWRELRRVRPEIFHAYTIKPIIYGLIAARLASVPVRIASVTGLGHAFVSAPAWLTKIASTLLRWALRSAHLVYFENADDRDFFCARKIVREAQTHVIPGSGVDLARFSPPTDTRPAASPFTFLYIGRLIEEKGIRTFLAAAADIQDRKLPFRCEIVGDVDPSNPSSLSPGEMEQAQREGSVVWHGAVDDVRPYISSADAVVLPSYREGVPLALIEGAAMGRAIIATDAPGCREPVRDGVTGLLVPVNDVPALIGAMIDLANDRHRSVEMGRRGREYMRDRFDSKLIFAEILGNYERLTQRQARRQDCSMSTVQS